MGSAKGTMSIEEERKTLRDDLQVLLVLTAGPEKGKKFELKYLDIAIGRAGSGKEYDVEINDNYISGSSGAHAFLNFSGNTIYIQDNESTNGTYVDGQAVQKGMMEEVVPRKTVVRLGKVTEFQIDIRKRPKPEGK
jgi:pSer/pThr/pTyr-binding forkhead associated (FHA) protein